MHDKMTMGPTTHATSSGPPSTATPTNEDLAVLQALLTRLASRAVREHDPRNDMFRWANDGN